MGLSSLLEAVMIIFCSMVQLFDEGRQNYRSASVEHFLFAINILYVLDNIVVNFTDSTGMKVNVDHRLQKSCKLKIAAAPPCLRY